MDELALLRVMDERINRDAERSWRGIVTAVATNAATGTYTVSVRRPEQATAGSVNYPFLGGGVPAVGDDVLMYSPGGVPGIAVGVVQPGAAHVAPVPAASTAKTYVQECLADGPIALWPLDEASGDFLDVSGYGRTATAVGSPTRGVAGPVAGHNATEFNGTTQYGSYAGDANMLSSQVVRGELTLETFAWVIAFSTASTPLLSRLLNPNGFEWNLEAGSAAAKLFDGAVYQSPGSGNIQASVADVTAAATGQWYHVAMTYQNAGEIRLIVNGASVAVSESFTSTAVNTASAIEFARAQFSTTRWSNVRMAYPAIYPRQLALSRVKAHYDARNNT